MGITLSFLGAGYLVWAKNDAARLIKVIAKKNGEKHE